MELSDEGHDIAEKIVNIALAHAAESFSKLANKSITLHSIEIPLEKSFDDRIDSQLNTSEELNVLITYIKGEFSAASYLIFTKDAGEVVSKMLSPGTKVSEEFIDAMLLEVDNILTASVVTQLSNFFDVDIYGDVPDLKKLNKKETEELIQESMKSYPIRYSFKTSFMADDFSVFPHFIWVMPEKFSKSIELLEKDENKLAELESFKDYVEKYLQFN